MSSNNISSSGTYFATKSSVLKMNFQRGLFEKETLLIVLSINILYLTFIYLYNFRSLWYYLVVIPVIFLLPVISQLSVFFEKYARVLMIGNLLYAGKGLSTKEIKALRFVFTALATFDIIMAGFFIVHAFLEGVQLVNTLLLIVLLAITILIYFSPRAIVDYWASERKINIEVEIPYLLILFRVMSSLRLPLYDMFRVIENSVALRTSAREVKFARKVATMTSSSFLTAMDIVCANHPSEKIRELFRRVVLAAISMGDVRDVVERVYDSIYQWFEARVSGLTERFTIIVGSAIFVYLFVPVTVAAITPVLRDSILLVLGMTISLQIFVFFILYALITSIYPSSFVTNVSTKLLITSAISLPIVLGSLAYLVLSYSTRKIEINQYYIYILMVVSMVPSFIFSEKDLKKVILHDRFIKMTADALSLAAFTGESAASALERSSRKYGRDVIRLTRSVLTSYLSEPLRKAVVSRAPSVYHASFMETLIVMLIMGSSPDMMRVFSSGYERLNVLVTRIRGFAKSIELIMVALTVLVGGFLSYIDRVYEYIANLTKGLQFPLFTPPVFAYDPAIYGVISALTVFSSILISFFVGKIRGGSILFCYRTAIIMISLLTIVRYLLTNLLI